MRTGRKLALLTAVTAVVMGIPVVASAQATADYTVQMGSNVPKGFSTRVLAPTRNGVPTIDISSGDIVNLRRGAILLPEGQGPVEWASDNTQGLDTPFGFVASDPDADLQQPFPSDALYKCNICTLPPTTPDCGASAEDPCIFDGSQLLFSGDVSVSGNNFFVQFDQTPGNTTWAVGVQQYNRPSSLRINIVPTGVTTQAFIDEAAAELAAREKDEASALYAKLNSGSAKHKTASGQVIYDAFVGYDTDTIALFDMFPANLNIRKGDKVRFHFSQLSIELHGTALPLSSALEIVNNGFLPVCDPDGDGGEGPDEFSVDFETFTCPSGTLELDLTRDLTAESGDGKFPGGPQKVENSGLRGAIVPTAEDLAGGGAAWDLIFTKPNAEGYKYICTVHGKSMAAKVTVRP